MTDEEKRSCYTCEHQSLCYLKRHIYDALVPSAAWMLDSTGLPHVWTDVFDTLAEACNQYTKMKGAETK